MLDLNIVVVTLLMEDTGCSVVVLTEALHAGPAIVEGVQCKPIKIHLTMMTTNTAMFKGTVFLLF